MFPIEGAIKILESERKFTHVLTPYKDNLCTPQQVDGHLPVLAVPNRREIRRDTNVSIGPEHWLFEDVSLTALGIFLCTYFETDIQCQSYAAA